MNPNETTISLEHQALISMGIDIVPLDYDKVTDKDSSKNIVKLLDTLDYTDEYINRHVDMLTSDRYLPMQNSAPVDQNLPVVRHTVNANMGTAALAAVPNFQPVTYAQYPQQVPQQPHQNWRNTLSFGEISGVGFLAIITSFILSGGLTPKPVDVQQLEAIKAQQEANAEIMLAYAESNKRSVCILAVGCGGPKPTTQPVSQPVSQPVATQQSSSTVPDARLYVQTWKSQGSSEQEIRRFAEWQRKQSNPNYPPADSILAAL